MSSLINKDTINDIYDAIDEINDLMFDKKTYPYAPVLNIKNALPIPAVDCKVKVKPIQDLHGYDHPWPAGGGKNKLPLVLADIKANNTDGTWSGNVYSVANGTIEIMTDDAGNVTGIKANGTFNNDVYFNINEPIITGTLRLTGCPSDGDFGTTYALYQFRPSIGAIANDSGGGADIDVQANDAIWIVIRNGASVSNAIFKPMVGTDMSATYATFAPYSNMCPISGIDELKIPVSGKNRLPLTVEKIKELNSNVAWTGNTGTLGGATVNILTDSKNNVTGIEFDGNILGGIFYLYNGSFNSGNYIVKNNCNKDIPGGYHTLQVIADGSSIKYVGTNMPQGFSVVNSLTMMLAFGQYNLDHVVFTPLIAVSTETNLSFEPYNPNSHTTTIPLPSTLYGGTVRVDEGDADSRFGIVDENDFGEVFGTSVGGLHWCDAPVGGLVADNLLSNMLLDVNSTEGWYSSEPCCTLTSRGTVRVYGTFTSIEEFKAQYAGLQVCYKLATPTTISFDPTNVELLEGTNVVSTNGESIEMTVGGLVDNIDYLGSDQIITGKKTINNDLYVNGDIYIWGTKFNNKYMFGFHIDSSESDGDATVTYLNDARGITPAYMDYTTGKFNYGGWGDAFFMPKPCMLKYDGTVDYYLDPNDFSKTINGASSDISDFSYDGNAMIEWGRDNNLIWVSVIPDSNSEDGSSYTVRIANYEADSTFHPWSHYAYNNKIVPHFYTPIYNGTIDGSGRLRSISGKDYTAYCKNKSRAEEIAAAMANDPDANTKIWYTETLADNKLIEYLLTLISKSLASQTKFGEGRTGYQWAESNLATTGLMDAKGMFYGENTTTGLGVKVFGREHRWGNQWQAEAGLINDNGAIKVKLTRGTVDGSSASDYNTDATGYLTVANITPTDTSGSYIKKAKADSMGIVLPFDASGSASTYYGDGLWFNNGQLNYALRGGSCGHGSHCGAFSSVLDDAPGYRDGSIGAGLSCKPFL